MGDNNKNFKDAFKHFFFQKSEEMYPKKSQLN